MANNCPITTAVQKKGKKNAKFHTNSNFEVVFQDGAKFWHREVQKDRKIIGSLKQCSEVFGKS